jgi:DNA-binding MarR family transcriptional regulator
MRILTANARVLLAVLENPEMTQSDIARMLDMHYQHVWRALDRLVQEGILNKRRENRRTYFVAADGFWQIDDIQRLKACVA